MARKNQFKKIDEYIAQFPKNVSDVLQQLRHVIKESAPKAEETISYAMPAFKLNRRIVVYFAAYKNHVGFYPTSSGVKAFEKELTLYQHSKGTIQFPLNKPIPIDLVKKIVKFRVREIETKKN